jgi:(p)ppGpp synthase/HD superfamily hydrolase
VNAGAAAPYHRGVEWVPTVEDAITLAARAHRGQRPSPEAEPYIFHPLRVMLSLGDLADRIVAMLHDVVEGTDVDLANLVASGCPPEVVVTVDALSRRTADSYGAYIERVAANGIVRRVKLADLSENLANLWHRSGQATPNGSPDTKPRCRG